MHVTLHLTNGCNMACDYCYVPRDAVAVMGDDTARAAVDLAAGRTPQHGSTGIIFFGGEPLLHKDLIARTVEYAEAQENDGRCFHFKVTTNGLLLDEDFLEYAQRKHMLIALSLDGCAAAHDRHRRDADGAPTFDRVADSARRLLRRFPHAPALMTVNPDTAPLYADSVQALFDLGFRYLICSLNVAAPWQDRDLEVLLEQYQKMARLYERWTLAEEKFYLSPFEVKLSSHIHQDTYCRERCELGKKQISVAPDGGLFPCVQFVGDGQWSIGSVATGIDEARREQLYRLNETEQPDCARCAICARCNHHCGCMNRQGTGRLDAVAPIQCAHERLLMPIADALAARLYRRRSAIFLQKHYNDFYPLVSMVEERTPGK